MQRKHLLYGIYIALGTMTICIYILQSNTPGLVYTITGLMRTNVTRDLQSNLTRILQSNVTRILQSNLTRILNVSGTSQTSKVDSPRLLANHYLIYPKPDGRLGNWLFQCASAFGIASTLRYHFCIEPSHPLNTYFEINYKCEFTITNIKAFGEMECRNESWRNDKSYIFYNLTTNGYLQSWKYFHNISHEVRNMLSFKPKFLLRAQQRLENINNHSERIVTIGIHVRRGDFLWGMHQTMGYTIASMEYITRAMNFYRYKTGRTLFVVVSGDMKWCKDNINGSDVIYSHSTEAIMDLAFLSLCDHIIITGGSFGWWAGWLSGGTVVYLKDFPRPGSVLEKLTYNSKKEYYPPHWIGFRNN